MTAVIIGIDPHKGSHTAVAIVAAEAQLGTLRVRASAAQAGRLLEWAALWPERTWAVEGAAAGAPAGPAAARRRRAGPGHPAQARLPGPAAVLGKSARTTQRRPLGRRRRAALPARRAVIADDHPVVLKIWSKRHRDLARLRCQAACRLHAVLCEVVPGGVPGPSPPQLRLPHCSTR